MNNKLHPFEKAGLGKAPFVFVGHERRVGPIRMADGTECGAPGQPMGTCDYCSNGIADCYTVKSADGKQFVVGCDCIMKLYAGSNVEDNAWRAIKRKVNEVARVRRHAAEAVKIDAVHRRLCNPVIVARLSAMPHHHPYYASQGKTMLDAFQFSWDASGNAGRIALGKRLDDIMAEAEAGSLPEAKAIADAR